ncbi:MAG: TonB family protein [Candidatus Omnitrophica bacterium]|nr:TonB family protein [Candidatus Omnitrophota bacterium]
MIRDNLLKKSLFISIFFHSVLIMPWKGFNFTGREYDDRFNNDPILVAYKISKEESIKYQQPELKRQEVSVDTKQEQIEAEVKDAFVADNNFLSSEREAYQQDFYTFDENQVVSLSSKMDSEDIPKSVLDYYSSIREEIKKRAFYYKPQEGIGAVTVIFGIDSGGIIRNLVVDELRSTDRKALRSAALKSVKQASPFAHFPDEIKSDFITFSITIEFELGN